MSSRRQREKLRLERMAFDDLVEARRNAENPAKVIFDLQAKNAEISEEKVEPIKESTPKKKTTTTKKKTSQKGEK